MTVASSLSSLVADAVVRVAPSAAAQGSDLHTTSDWEILEHRRVAQQRY